ncbi:ATP-binding protein [Fictibacillus sp. B-59209]|uniref:ATP-binding protein n=1 Tax=Fictibacillus sp. B-59209 TaxID=3024873 RepID=UPI002E1BE2F3|nr:ATP-binding protein [Fictibacillus sp. B-59209]
MIKNDFVYYLDQFNVLSPNHAKIYDEYTNSAEKFAFTIDTKVEDYLERIFLENPRSVILTGNAGDGKTRLCRQIYNSLGKENLMEWPESGIINLTFSKGVVRIVKDLSELKDEVIYQELKELDKYIGSTHKEKIYYLIAANEGKLTKFLSQYDELGNLREMVKSRFQSFENNDNNLSIINLLDVTSSVYVEKVLKEWNKEENWDICKECPMNKRCIIYHNHRKSSEDTVQNSMVNQYRTLDYLNTHITMREMLIHNSYVLTGGYTCSDIYDADYKELAEQTKKVYYQNFYGHGVSHEAFSEMKAMKVFKSLDPGEYSHSVVDDFIINGDISGNDQLEAKHKEIFDNSIDLQFGYFLKQLKLYRDHNKTSDHSLIAKWIPQLRRKLFFELGDLEQINIKALLPFEYVEDYEKLFNDRQKQNLIRKDLSNGLNRAFSKKLVENNKTAQILATSENLLIHESFQNKRISFIEEAERKDLDRRPSIFKLIVDDEVELTVNLFLFEFLMRLNGGSTLNILQQEVDILIDTFKNELIQISDPNDYELNILRLDRNKGLFIEDTIMIP